MFKRILVAFLLAGLLFPGSIMADDTSKTGNDCSTQICTGRAEYHNLRMCLDYVVDQMAGLDLKFNDVRVSPIIRSEQWYEVPVELSWLGTQDKLVPIFEKLLAYTFAESKLAHDAINISVSAETCDNQPLLVVTSQERLMCFNFAEKQKNEGSAEFMRSIARRNQQIVRVIRSLLAVTTFTQQVGKRIQGSDIGQGKTWLTNLRMDSDNRLQLTGYGLDAKQVTRLGEELLKSGSFPEVYLSCMNKNVFEKVPVWRFNFTLKASN